MKKLLSIVLALSLCLTAMMGCFVVSAETTVPTITVADVTAAPGAVEITITGENFSDVCAADLEITLAEGLTFVSLEKDNVVLEGSLEAEDGVDYVVNGQTIKYLDLFNGFEGYNTTTLNLTINATAVADGAYAVTAAVVAATIDEDFIEGIVINNGTVTIHTHTYTVTKYDEEGHWTACACEDATAVTEKVAHTLGDYVANEDGTTETATCTGCEYSVTRDKENVEVTPVADYKFGHSVQLKANEPWGIFFNGRINIGGTTLTNAQYSELNDYGAYILVSTDWEGTEAPTTEEVMASEKSKVYTKLNGGAVLKTVSGSLNAQVTFDENLFTYEMGKELYVVFFAEDANGYVHNGGVRTRSLRATLDVYLNNAAQYTPEVIALCNAMINMYDKTVAYNGGQVPEREISVPTKLSDYATFGAPATDVAYTVGHTMQLYPTEPWGIAFNGVVRLNGKAIDYSTCSDYGVIIYSDSTAKYAEVPTIEQLLSEDNALVYSKNNGAVSFTTNASGEKCISADYSEKVYTYQMEQPLYAAFYVVIDGNYYYGTVRQRSFVSVIEQYLGAASQYPSNMIDLLNAMKTLYAATNDYLG